jgi:uncharacterized protein YjiK
MLMFLFPKKIALLAVSLSLCFCCSQKPASKGGNAAEQPSTADALPYDLENPSLTINLVSGDLQEVSGLSPTDVPGQYLAIADERGEAFFVDGAGGGAILRRVLFREKGDFEGIEMVGQTLYALKSDGKIFEIKNWKNGPPEVLEYDTPLRKEDDLEGLGYDAARHALLLASKGNPDSAHVRNVYAFDLKTKTLGATPLYRALPEEVNKMLPYDQTEKHDYFSPSGIAIHPKTNDVYIISTALKRLVVLDYATGVLKYVARLDKKILPQPEGIAFDAVGNLHLSSEGKKGEGLLLRFDYKRKK